MHQIQPPPPHHKSQATIIELIKSQFATRTRTWEPQPPPQVPGLLTMERITIVAVRIRFEIPATGQNVYDIRIQEARDVAIWSSKH